MYKTPIKANSTVSLIAFGEEKNGKRGTDSDERKNVRNKI